MCFKTFRIRSINLIYILTPFLLFGCETAGTFKFEGDVIGVRYTNNQFAIDYMSKEETRDIATEQCKNRFGSDSVTMVDSTWGYGENW